MSRTDPSAPLIVTLRSRLRARDVLRNLPLDPRPAAADPATVPAPRLSEEQLTPGA